MTPPMPWPGSRVLVTGGSGFLGRPLCRALLKTGAEVHATTRRPRAGLDPTVRWHGVDLADWRATDAVVGSVAPQIVYHLAGQVTGVRDAERVIEVFRDTLASTVHVLAAAQRHASRRVVLASSMEEPDGRDAVATPSSPYAAAKWASGGYGRMYASLYDLEVVELRVFMTYGPGHQPTGKLVPAVILGLLRGRPPALGSGQRRVDWVYVDDVVDALVRAATAAVPPGVRPDVGSGRLTSLREFAERLAHHVDPAATLQFGTGQDRGKEREAVADVTASEQVLDWRPRTSLDEGLKEVVAWYRKRFEAGEFREA